MVKEKPRELRTKSLPKEMLVHARKVLNELIAKNFGGNVLAASTAYGVAQSTLNDFVTDKKGIGIHALLPIVEHERISLDEILGRDLPRVATADLRTFLARNVDDQEIRELVVQNPLRWKMKTIIEGDARRNDERFGHSKEKLLDECQRWVTGSNAEDRSSQDAESAAEEIHRESYPLLLAAKSEPAKTRKTQKAAMERKIKSK